MSLYTKQELHRAYEEIALTRKRVCTGCGTSERLSHSHLIQKSWSGKYAAMPENITFHCLDSSDKKGCHSRWESPECVLLKDFESNFKVIFKLDRAYFWLRLEKLDTLWQRRDRKVWLKVRAFYKEMDELQHSENGSIS